jgi:GT2 family glycosyltransferase
MKVSAIIPTLGRPHSLVQTLDALARQSKHPVEVIVVDGNPELDSSPLKSHWPFTLSIKEACPPSAAAQRNAGADAALTSSDLLLFIDDDIVPAHSTCEKLIAAFSNPEIGAVSARMLGGGHSQPRGLLRAYYRFQAGYNHPTYGGHLFGPAIACLPAYNVDQAPDGLITARWLPSGMLMVRRDVFFSAGGFPSFDGYSALEDVYLTAAIARMGHKLAFHTTACFEHLDPPSPAKRDRAALARMRLANRRLVAEEFLGLHGARATFKFFLLRLFDTFAILRQRPPGWPSELKGTWLP